MANAGKTLPIATLMTTLMGGLLLTAVPATAASLDEAQLDCLLQPSRTVAISSQVPGVVSQLSVERGERVSKGQKLLALESGVEKAALESARLKAKFAQRKHKRNQELVRKGLLSEFETDEIVTELRLAESAVNEAKARLEQRVIYSPISGLVAKRDISVGEYVGAESVLDLVALNPLHAEINLHSSYYGKLEAGMPVTVEVSGPSGGRIDGTVKIVDKVIDAASGTFSIRVELPNPDKRTPAGLPCRLVVAGSEA